ncbi:ZIP zinc/iron transport family [Thozetella sp. PMI_491]|nr:ZIP zinc/iron transport family [Thozetella sp. PMI_491]
MSELFHLLALRADDADPSNSTAADGGDTGADAAPVCETGAPDDSHFSLRIGSIFIILASSLIGALLPVILSRASKVRTPKAFYFIAKYFGTGVILATAFMHLLDPAIDALGQECLEPQLGDYPWALAISLMTVMVMFLVELIISNFELSGHSHSHSHDDPAPAASTQRDDIEASSKAESDKKASQPANEAIFASRGEDHLGHSRDHVAGDSYAEFGGQLTAIAILEFGVVLHSVFIGLTLAVTDNFIILLVVLTFHQMFEGLGLGARLAAADWPHARRFWPYYLGTLYALSTPLAIAVGLGVRETMSLEGSQSLITNGVLDSISSGILIYTALVELLAHEFMFNVEMRKAGLSLQLRAYVCVALGVALMSLLAKWA